MDTIVQVYIHVPHHAPVIYNAAVSSTLTVPCLFLFTPQLDTQKLTAENKAAAELYAFRRQRFINSVSKHFLDTFNEFSLVFKISDHFTSGNTKPSKTVKFLIKMMET